MNATATRQALLRDILANPASDALRLIYADLVEQEGEEEFAEFIRVQVELERLCQIGFAHAREIVANQFRNVGEPDGHEDERIALRRRGLELLILQDEGPALREWARNSLLKGLPGKLPVVWLDDLTVSVGKGDEVKGPPKKYFLRRGFVWKVECSCDDWCEYGSWIVACQPVEVVRLTDKEPGAVEVDPWLHTRYRYWAANNPGPQDASDVLPVDLFNLLPWQDDVRDIGYTFDSRESSQDALSVACLRLAKGEKP